MKKVLSIILSLVMVLCALPLSAVESVALTDGDYEYTVENNKATVTGYTGMDTDIAIPSTLGGYPVIAIGNRAFESCTLTSVTIPDSVITIGNDAFKWCYSLSSVTIGNSVTSIGHHAFDRCALTSVIIPDSVTEIRNDAFCNCPSLVSVTIGNSVTNIESFAFFGCGSLTSVTIGNGVTTIGENAFFGCTSLISLIIPESVTTIGDNAFYGCSYYFAIFGVSGSYAETYAYTNNIPFNPGNRVLISVFADGISDTTSLWSLTDGHTPANNYFSGSIINVVNNGVIQTEDILTLTLNVPNGCGCDGTITNAGVTQRVNDGDNQIPIIPEGVVTINLHFYSRDDYTTLYFRNPLDNLFFSQKYPKTETSFTFPENSFTNLHGIFNNWNTASDGTGTVYQPNQIETLPSVDTSYYTKWDDAYFVSFNKNGGTGSMAKIGVLARSQLPSVYYAPECEFTRNGYAFTGWNTKASGSGDSYQPDELIMLTENITLYAQWTKAWTVYLHSNFGSDTTVRQEVAKGQTANITANPFTRGGYRFVGWNTAADGSGTAYADEASITPTGAVYLYAQWVHDIDMNDDGYEDINDIAFILSVSVGNITNVTPAQLGKADLNNDGVVDAFDAAWLDRYYS